INVLGYAVCDGGCDAGANWQVVPLLSMDFGSNGPFSLALTAEGGPRLVFYDGNSLAYVWCDADCTDPANWGGAQTGLPQYSGQSGVDLALDASGNPVLAYSGASDTVSVDSANVAACTSACQTSTASWTSEVIETYQDINTSPPDPCLTGKSYWQLGQAPSLALDDAGVAHVSYATFSGGTCPAGHDDQGNRYEEVFELNGPLRYAQP
ncbi:MAG TPA: hypothetical protein VF171_02375, partial [Trueperaceae bacterium]